MKRNEVERSTINYNSFIQNNIYYKLYKNFNMVLNRNKRRALFHFLVDKLTKVIKEWSEVNLFYIGLNPINKNYGKVNNYTIVKNFYNLIRSNLFKLKVPFNNQNFKFIIVTERLAKKVHYHGIMFLGNPLTLHGKKTKYCYIWSKQLKYENIRKCVKYLLKEYKEVKGAPYIFEEKEYSFYFDGTVYDDGYMYPLDFETTVSKYFSL